MIVWGSFSEGIHRIIFADSETEGLYIEGEPLVNIPQIKSYIKKLAICRNHPLLRCITARGRRSDDNARIRGSPNVPIVSVSQLYNVFPLQKEQILDKLM